MAKRLRWRLIVASMSALFVVMCVIVLAINLVNFGTVRDNADAVLDAIDQGGGTFATLGTGDVPPALPDSNEPNKAQESPNRNRWIDRETPFETRFFTVRYVQDQPVVFLDRIAMVDEQTAISMANDARQKGGTYGYNSDYRYKVAQNNLVIFVDCNKQLYTARQFLYTSLYVSAAALVAMFVLVYIFSKYAVKPIVEACDKQKRFITEASHELKTPLTIISANNELQELECGETQSTAAIDKQVKRMTKMVKNMVALSRLDESETLQETRVFSLDESLAETIDAMRAALEDNGRALQVELQKDIAYKGNEELVRQLFSILLDNAAKYAKTHTSVRLSCARGGAVLEVRNDACDLADGDMSQCFERFYRSPLAREGVEGSGIGLSIAKQIATLHHADIAAYAKDGEFVISVKF